jgi:hypothetical protein
VYLVYCGHHCGLDDARGGLTGQGEQAIASKVLRRVDDTQTWLSAALTYDVICTDVKAIPDAPSIHGP